jgi:hypothetical protein
MLFSWWVSDGRTVHRTVRTSHLAGRYRLGKDSAVTFSSMEGTRVDQNGRDLYATRGRHLSSAKPYHRPELLAVNLDICGNCIQSKEHDGNYSS